ncbi:helix-turn-helix domain-containing protein [Paenibacillus ferrarius]|uniref:helix-turn-helix domain-containing protein n=1 Tax=Paenibacillus ferrarius TaxID=1469647 RepID=UPI003D2982BD
MDISDAIPIRPRLVGHIYWKEKTAFQFREDTNEYWVAFAVESGRFSYQIGEEEGVGGFGDLVICPPGVVFRREVVQPLWFHVMNFDWIQDDGHTPPANLLPSGKITIQDLSRLSSNYAYLKKWYDFGGPSSHAFRQHVLTDIWMQYVEEHAAVSQAHSASWASSESTGKDALIHQAVQMMQESADSSCSLKSIAQELGITQVQFTRRFKKSTGMLPIDYLTTLRLQKVQRLLLDSDLTLQQIAGQSGFENEFYLSRVFKKRMHMSPSYYRKLHRL